MQVDGTVRSDKANLDHACGRSRESQSYGRAGAACREFNVGALDFQSFPCINKSPTSVMDARHDWLDVEYNCSVVFDRIQIQ